MAAKPTDPKRATGRRRAAPRATSADASRAPETAAGAWAIGGDVAAELAGLRHSLDQLTQGLTQLLDATTTHTKMLRALMAAATAPTDPERDLAEVLGQVVSRLAEQSALLRSIGGTITRLPEDVGTAVGAQMASALATVR